jgi:YD repeat-containing protein
VHELNARDIDNDSSDDYTLGYDAVGNLTDDGESYKYEYDAFGRMRKILDRSDDSLVAEYVYNGLGFMISVHEDTDTDGDVDANDLWYHHAYDERWRMLATYREDDSDPKEEFIVHDAGLDGMGRSAYINGLVCRDKDANTAWTAESDGVLEERLY